MKNSLLLRIFGSVLVLIGLGLVVNPELVSNNPIPANTYEAIERRIWWGLIIGLGVLLLLHQQIRPWLLTLAAALSALLFGLLVARLIGIFVDGSVAKQWLNVGIEGVILAPLVWWYLKLRGRSVHESKIPT